MGALPLVSGTGVPGGTAKAAAAASSSLLRRASRSAPPSPPASLCLFLCLFSCLFSFPGALSALARSASASARSRRNARIRLETSPEPIASSARSEPSGDAPTRPSPPLSSSPSIAATSRKSRARACATLSRSPPHATVPPFLGFRLRRLPQAMMEKRGPPCWLPAVDPFVDFGTPCLNRLFTSVVKAKTSPFLCGKENCEPLGSCRNASSRSPPKLAPMVKSSRCSRPPYACESWWKGFQSVPSR
mmetsp:Transcript_11537/g.48393  ORF Transcript_11537/g.48393 Transcript_11537/m.48393 type:complete len:246 (+) Transcript_11537:479-1216(+)